MNRLRLVAVSALIACAPLAAGPWIAVPWIAEPVAVAQAPTTYTDVVTDNAGVLSEAEKGKLVEAIQDVQRKEQRKIYVVFTEDFGGLSGEEWAKQAKQRNDGRNVLVYGVAVKSRDYGLAYGADWNSDADDMKKAAYNKLVESDYYGSAMALVDASSTSSGSNAAWLGSGAAAVVATGAGLAAYSRRKRTKQTASMTADARAINPKDTGSLMALPIDVLENLSQEELVSTDESLRKARA